MEYKLNADYIPPLPELRGPLVSGLARLMEDEAVIHHEEVLARLEQLSTGYVLRALSELGWVFRAGRTFSLAGMASTLRVTRRHRRLLERFLMMLEDDGILRRSDDLWEVTCEPPEAFPGAGLNNRPAGLPASDPDATLLDCCGSKLSEILRGGLDPLQLLFPQGDPKYVATFYRESPVLRAMNLLARQLIARVLLRLPDERGFPILEIGAGTGGTTACLLPLLPPDRTDYTFTDVSLPLTMKAKQEFSDYHFVRYGVLNIEGDPRRQGFHSGQYDVVVAANVIHATRDVTVSLRNAGQLLKPGGLLIMLEMTAPVRWVDLVFGLTQGWWRFTDTGLRPSYPLLSVAAWIEVLNRTGFEEAFSVSPEDLPAQRATTARKVFPQALIVAKAAARTS